MIRLCAKIVAETDLYETDREVQNLIDWVCLSEQIKENNNTIRNMTGEYKKIDPDCREGVRAQLERMKELCKERNSLYEKQNDLKGQKYEIEKSLNDKNIQIGDYTMYNDFVHDPRDFEKTMYYIITRLTESS